MTAATLLQAILHLPGVATLGSAFGGIPHRLPRFALPDLSPSHIITLIGPAFTIALLGAIESLLSAVVADGMAGSRHDSNQEFRRALLEMRPPPRDAHYPARARALHGYHRD